MGCCASKSSDESNATSFPASSSSHHPKARRRYHNKRYPAAHPSSPKPPNNKAHHAAVSPLTSFDDVDRVKVKEVLTERPPSASRPRPTSAPRARNNSANNSIDGPAAKKKSGPAASSFSFDKKDSPAAGDRNQTIPLASDIWSITGAAPMAAPPKRGNHGAAAAIQLSSEIWSIANGPPRMAPPPMMMMSSAAAAAAARRPGPVPFAAPRKYSSPGKRESAVELNRYSAERERGSTMSPVKREAWKKNSYGSPGSRRGERQGPYLAGRERPSPLSRESERERRPVAISPQKREKERNSSGSLRNGGGSSEMRRWADMEEEGYGRRSAGSPAVREGKKNGRGSWGVSASPDKENARKTNKGRNATVSPSGRGNESSDSSLSIEGFVFL
ncbi:unnamed protein product [Linum trigynum]|uniref:Uncharacterized protein n=1 Tax=Linum trigynum TaxID=586398 RepID=A0AAV2GAX3_9ROSI